MKRSFKLFSEKNFGILQCRQGKRTRNVCNDFKLFNCVLQC